MLGSPANATSQAPQSVRVPQNHQPRPVFLAVRINGQDGYGTALLMTHDLAPNDSLYATPAEFKHWRLAVPTDDGETYANQVYHSLLAIPGLSYKVNSATGTLSITAPAAAFVGTTLVRETSQRRAVPSHGVPGGFLNYGLFALGTSVVNQLTGQLEAGVFNAWGVGTSRFLLRHDSTGETDVVRLNTVWRHDNPATMTSLSLGDTVTRGGPIGGSALIGGITFGTNFETRPYLLTFPLPTLEGDAVTPSTVRVYANGQLTRTQQIPPGHFRVPNIPLVSGPDQIKLVVRDALGREQILTRSFYSSSKLLKPGLSDYSVAIGKLRNSYGYRSNDYGELVANGLYRRALTRNFTLGVHADYSSHLRNLGVTGLYANKHIGILRMGLGTSQSQLGRGLFGMISWSMQWRLINASISARFANPRFTLLGYGGRPLPRRFVIARVGGHINRMGSLFLSWLDRDNGNNEQTRLARLTYRTNLGPGFLNASAYQSMGRSSDTGIAIAFSLPFGQRSNAHFGVHDHSDALRGFARIRKSLPSGRGFGYQFGTEYGPDSVSQASVAYQNDVGTWRLGATGRSGVTTYRASATGGFAFADGQLFASRRIHDAFGVVQVPGLSDVTVYSNHQPIATTNDDGYALVPQLLSYQNNSLSIHAVNLPLDVQVGASHLNAVPRYRSGVLVRFPVTRLRAATMTIMQSDGTAVPAGATARIAGHDKEFPVGYNGQAYVTGLKDHNTIEVTWNNRHCSFTLTSPPTKDPLPELGSFTCVKSNQ